MAHSAPGKSDREGITVLELGDMFPGRGGGPRMVRAAYLARRRASLPALRQRADA